MPPKKNQKRMPAATDEQDPEAMRVGVWLRLEEDTGGEATQETAIEEATMEATEDTTMRATQ